jgi:hypothetical protein
VGMSIALTPADQLSCYLCFPGVGEDGAGDELG